MTVPPDRTDAVRALFEADPGTAHLAVLPGACLRPPGDLVLPDVARESADRLIAELRALGVDRDGGISMDAVDAAVSRRPEQAEPAATGEGSDAIVWEQVVRPVSADASLSVSFLACRGRNSPLSPGWSWVPSTDGARLVRARAAAGRPPPDGIHHVTGPLVAGGGGAGRYRRRPLAHLRQERGTGRGVHLGHHGSGGGGHRVFLALGDARQLGEAAARLGINVARILVAAAATLLLQKALWQRVPTRVPAAPEVAATPGRP